MSTHSAPSCKKLVITDLRDETFIGNLAFQESQAMLETAKLGILAASILSGILGLVVLKKVTARHL